MGHKNPNATLIRSEVCWFSGLYRFVPRYPSSFLSRFEDYSGLAFCCLNIESLADSLPNIFSLKCITAVL
jgi:hypothetical protein